MLEGVEAVRFDRVMKNGRTKPILMACECMSGDGAEVEVIAKFSHGCDKSTDGLVREALAAMLAKDLELPVPQPFVVSVSPAFIQTIEDTAVVEHLSKSNSLGFGSKKLPDGFSIWTATSGKLSPEQIQAALDIFAFDCFLTNADRRVSNPNLLTDGNGFAIFDHEYTFLRELNIGWVEPWRPASLTGFNAPTQHVFFDTLKGRAGLSLTRLIESISAISDARINEYGQAIPPSWTTNPSAVTAGVELIANLRDNVQLAAQETLGALL